MLANLPFRISMKHRRRQLQGRYAPVLHRHGKSIREIARETGISRNTNGGARRRRSGYRQACC
jgi:transposase